MNNNERYNNYLRRRFSINDSMSRIGELGGRMVSPDDDVLDLDDVDATLLGQLRSRAVVIEASHRGKVLLRDGWSVVGAEMKRLLKKIYWKVST